MKTIVCVPKSLTPVQEQTALRRAIEINPTNADAIRSERRTPVGRRGGPSRLALLVGSRWPKTGVKLTVQFLDGAEAALRTRILSHMNAWSKTANIEFVETTGTGLVRIARLDKPPDMSGYWSYVGTQILGIDLDKPTFNLEGFTLKTPESEFRRVVRHEAGHTLGFEHEHMRTELVKKIDVKKAIAYFDINQGWSAAETRAQVLTPLAKKTIIGTTEADPISIMCYQIPGTITKDGKDIPGGSDINEKDFAFAATIYPKTGVAPVEPPHSVTTDATPPPPTPPLSPAPTLPPDAARRGANPAPDPCADTFQIVILDEFNSDDGKSASETQGAEDKDKRPKFARVLACYGGAQVTGAIQLHADRDEPSTLFGKIISMHEQIKKYTNRESGLLPSDQQLVQFGIDLFETLFQGDVRLLYTKACARQHGRKLDVVLTSMIPWIADKPWEFAYDPKRRSFLATEDVYMVRNVKTTVPADFIAPGGGPLRILVAAAQPVGFLPLSVEQEVEVIRRGFDPLIEAGLVQVEVIARATPEAIHQRLSLEQFTVVHFIGHSAFDEKTRKGILVFEDDRNEKATIGSRSARGIFCKRGVKLVFLNSCQSGDGGRWDPEDGIAQTLVSHGLPALVANQYSVLDSSATTFARHFYWALAQGMTIGRAACEARIAVNYSLQGEIIDWAVPVVYTRDPNLTLCPPSVQEVPLASSRGATRQTTRDRGIRVAVWDIDDVFPSLARTLERLNATQDAFGFQLVPLSIPTDAWDVESKAPDGEPYLWAEKLARRLQRTAGQLQVDVVACITGHWMRDDDTRNIYGWWPGDRSPQVVIFSCAGFDQLEAEGPATDRVIANVLVETLTGFLTGMGTHSDGSADCPMAYNETRDFAHLSGVHKFDPKCRRKLQAKIPDELPALEALLKTFR